MFRHLFSSPQDLFNVSNQQEREASVEAEQRLMIDEDGNASVNIACPDVEADFLKHVDQLEAY
ncbi:hypothetical protein BTJ39_00635 [Izhakiella australiensis]|uniref:Uncharacterized protein n=1 Tax=Izhakiella australiensis TaxID=1926881 RepID=A0A1S8YS78_9GAMM|nr:hypothetical protein [Izhakiella australiensis]OON41708.1 hypothetical protein BTJ39_00635 [Izhakiella australiensis]